MKKLLISFLILSIISILFTSYFYVQFSKSNNLGEDIVITIPENTTISSALKIVNQNGLLNPFWIFNNSAKLFAKFTDAKIYPGRYKFLDGTTNLQVLRKILSGGSILPLRATFPEGISIQKMASIASQRLNVDSSEFIYWASNDSLIRAFESKYKNLNGYLLPETYDFFGEPNAQDIVIRLLEQGAQIWTDENISKAKTLNLNKHQVLILASIVEAETPVKEEAATVAGLYLNRLRIGMPLQADPTVQFAIGSKRKLNYNDLQVNHPFNTYFVKGLPPAPINNPGKNAILAVLNPEKHNFLYMVAVGDGSGKHNFASNYNKHLQNVSKFRKMTAN